MTSAEVRDRIIEALEKSYDAPSEHGWEVVAGWVADLHEIQSQAQRLKNELLKYLHHVLPEYEVGLEVGGFRKTSGKKAAEWDHPMIASALAARAADDFGGEPPAVFANDVAQRVLSCAGISYWRKGDLKKNGIDPSRYSTEREDERGPTVIFTPAKAS